MRSGAAVSYRKALAVRDLRLLIFGSATSQIGDWLYNVALLVHVYSVTGSAAWVGATTAVRLIPYVVLAPVGGAIADRFDRRQVLIVSDLTRAALMGLLAASAAAHASVGIVVALAGLATAAGVAAGPAALAMVPDVVGEDRLAPANALLHTVQELGVVVGPAIGAVLVAFGSPSLAFAANAVTFLLSVVAVRAMAGTFRAPVSGAEDGDPAEPPARARALALLAAGARALWRTSSAPELLLIVVLCELTYGAQTVQLVVYAREALGLGDNGYGILLAAAGVGGVLSAALSARLAARPTVALAAISTGGLCVASQLAFAATATPAVAIVVAVASGIGLVTCEVVVETAIGRVSAPDVRGRIFGAYDSVSVAAMILGAIVAAPLLRQLGIDASMAALGGGALLILAACSFRLSGIDRRSRQVLDVLTPRIAVLERLEMLAGAPRVALERLASVSTEFDFASDVDVVRQDEVADVFYAIVTGTLVVSKRADDGTEAVVGQLGPGEAFGEIGLLHRIPRTATVTTASECSLLQVPGDEFLEALLVSSDRHAAARHAQSVRVGAAPAEVAPVTP